jgi:hypothetical protein
MYEYANFCLDLRWNVCASYKTFGIVTSRRSEWLPLTDQQEREMLTVLVWKDERGQEPVV